ncbi:MAG: zinc metalloprotease HtpX, partial [Nitrososphaerales archaeon]|nr:zinc metalloprotease HtpX [Nitrososphaerales archaeon]
ILSLVNALSFYTLIFFVVAINLIQWLIAPYLIDAMYRVKEISEAENPKIYNMVRRICQRTRFPIPKVMIANIPIPNAFAYGSPIAGRRVAVTTELLKTLEDEEVEAVLAHEIGHLKHRDVQIMMFASVLPAIVYYIGYSLMISGMYERRSREGGGALLIGIAAMALYWVLSLFVMGLSRLREYYADQHAVRNVDEGGRKLSEALAKITMQTGRYKLHHGNTGGFSSFKALFISDPDRADQDEVLLAKSRFTRTDSELVREILSRKVTIADRIMELFSTHPNIVKRIKALQGA